MCQLIDLYELQLEELGINNDDDDGDEFQTEINR